MKFPILKLLLAMCLGCGANFAHAKASDKGARVNKTAHQYISSFRHGASFNHADSVDAIIRNGRIDKDTLSILGKELATGTSSVRENIVKLLEKVGLELDPPQPEKYKIIRELSIISLLVNEAFAKTDAAATAAHQILLTECRPSDLNIFRKAYVESLSKGDGAFLYIAAKAKAIEARPFVEAIARSPAWQQYEEDRLAIRIAQAALGNTAIENEFIDAVYAAEKNAPPAPANRLFDVSLEKDGKEVAQRLETLGFIGTQRSLMTACAYLRSPLKTHMPYVKEQSIRHDALATIRYNFPDERVLGKPRTLADWAAAEQFCTQHIGAVFDGPTPDLPHDRAYPHPLPPLPSRDF